MRTEFRTPRFIGDPVLEAILRDPDTGPAGLRTDEDPVMGVAGQNG